MYKKVSLFLLVVFLVLTVFSGTIAYCYSMLINNTKVEDSSIYTNIIEGWSKNFNKQAPVLNKFYYVEPIGQIMFATDANNNYLYAFNDGDRFMKFGTTTYAKDKNNNYIYASYGDATYKYFYYATSSDDKYEYMYAEEEGGKYFTFDTVDGEYTPAKNEKNQLLVNNDNALNIEKTDVNFNKDAKIYYVVMLVSSAIAVGVLLSLFITFITGKVKEKKTA